MKSVFAIGLLYAAIVCCQNAKAQNTPATRGVNSTTIDTYIKKTMAETGMVGTAAAIIVDKKLVWTKGYGYADMENNTPFSPNTIMNIASISKVFTGVCLMKAVEDKQLSLDEDINTYLPFKVINPYFPNDKITLRNLATHTSTLSDRLPFYSDCTYFNGKDAPEKLGDFLRNYLTPTGKYYSPDNFLKYKPGTYREYCNIGAGLAGYIIELRTGKQLNIYSKQYILNPLKMTNTGWFFNEINLAKHTKLYDKQGDSVKPIPLYGATTYPDGGVRTSVNELAKFFISLLNDGKYNQTRILQEASVKEMLRFEFTPGNTPENVKPDKLNSGIFWATKFGGTRIGHNGTDPGVRTFMLADTTKEIGVILFVNTSLSEEQGNKYFEMYNELYKYGVSLKAAK